MLSCSCRACSASGEGEAPQAQLTGAEVDGLRAGLVSGCSVLGAGCEQGFKSRGDRLPVAWRSSASSRSICTGASTTTLTWGRSASAMRAHWLVCLPGCGALARPGVEPDQVGGQQQPCTPACGTPFQGARARGVGGAAPLGSQQVRQLARSSWAKSHGLRAASKARLLAAARARQGGPPVVRSVPLQPGSARVRCPVPGAPQRQGLDQGQPRHTVVGVNATGQQPGIARCAGTSTVAWAGIGFGGRGPIRARCAPLGGRCRFQQLQVLL